MTQYKHLLIRHAHRPLFKQGDWGHNVSITEEGVRESRILGQSLAEHSIHQIWSSPIKRCLETANEIREKSGCCSPVVSSNLLGEPGFLIEDEDVAGKELQLKGMPSVMHALLRKEHVVGFNPLEQGCTKFLSAMQQMGNINSIGITHDIIIAMLAAWSFQKSSYEDLLPSFLESMEITFHPEGCLVLYRGLKTMIDVTSFK